MKEYSNYNLYDIIDIANNLSIYNYICIMFARITYILLKIYILFYIFNNVKRGKLFWHLNLKYGIIRDLKMPKNNINYARRVDK